jgi:hypothetical protein
MAAPKGTRPPAAGKGRPKGSRNKMTRALKDMILQALDDVGGQQYLAEQRHESRRISRLPKGRAEADICVMSDTSGAVVGSHRIRLEEGF